MLSHKSPNHARWSQRRLPLEFMDGLSYTTIIELAEPLARRRGSALDRYEKVSGRGIVIFSHPANENRHPGVQVS